MDSEALIVPNKHHKSKGGEIRTPLDLKVTHSLKICCCCGVTVGRPQGKRIGVEFGSTSHYALASYFKEFGVEIMYETVSSN